MKSPSLNTSLASRNRLRWILSVFFVALLLPLLILLFRFHKQLRNESQLQLRAIAEDLADRIDDRLYEMLTAEEQRPATDYEFRPLGSSSDGKLIPASALSQYPPRSAIPALIGYFELDDGGKLYSPLLPKISLKSTLIDGYKSRVSEKRKVLNVLLAAAKQLPKRRRSELSIARGIPSSSKKSEERVYGGIENPISRSSGSLLTQNDKPARSDGVASESSLFSILSQRNNSRRTQTQQAISDDALNKMQVKIGKSVSQLQSKGSLYDLKLSNAVKAKKASRGFQTGVWTELRGAGAGRRSSS